MRKKKISSVLALLTGISSLAAARVPAISSVYFDTGKVKTIYLTPSIPALLDFPCNLQTSLKPTSGILQGASDGNPRHLTIWLKENEGSSLTVLCEDRVFVFNVLPSKEHQAYIRVLGSYGGPELQNENQKVILSSESGATHGRAEPKIKRIIMSSNGVGQ